MAEAEDASKRQRLGTEEGVTSYTAETAEEEGAVQETYVASAKALGMEEVLQKIMPLVGKGRHVFTATVCREWKEHYSMAHPSAETSLPSVVESVRCLQWAKEKCGYELSVGTSRAAAEYGDVSVCEELLHRLHCPWDTMACRAAVRNTRHGLRILKWLRSEDLPNKEQGPWSQCNVGDEAGKCGNVEVLTWLLSDEFEGPPQHIMWSGAVDGGRIRALDMLVHHPKVRAEMEAAGNSSGWRDGAFWAAAKGNLEVLQWLHANARELCRWDEDVCFEAVFHGRSLSVLKWLRSEEVMCPWDEWACPQYIKDRGDGGWDMHPAAFEKMKQWVHANGQHPCDCED